MATQGIGHGQGAQTRCVGRQVADTDQRKVQLADAGVLDHAGLGTELAAGEQLDLHLAVGQRFDQLLEALGQGPLVGVHGIAHADLEGLGLCGGGSGCHDDGGGK